MDFVHEDDIGRIMLLDQLNSILENYDEDLNFAEEVAIAEMTPYINVRYDAAETFKPENKTSFITMKVIDIMLYHLHANVSPDNVPELREKRYKQAIDWCEKIADGFISAPLPLKGEEVKSNSIRYGSTLPKQDHYF